MTEELKRYATPAAAASRVLRARAGHIRGYQPTDAGTLEAIANRLDELVTELGGVQPSRENPLPKSRSLKNGGG